MKKFLTILFLVLCFKTYSQNQIVELCEDSDKTFTYSSIGTPNCEYTWEVYFNNKLINTFKLEEIKFTFKKQGYYRIEVFSENTVSCRSVKEIYEIEVIPCRFPGVFTPNAFTPNGNKLNDGWRPIGSYIESMTVYVYNKWGNLIFKTIENDVAWDGTFNGMDVPSDVYIYYIEYLTIKGSSGYKKGTITLYR